jgi:hypothetical protein
MPIEIKELVIKTTVNQVQEESKPESSAPQKVSDTEDLSTALSKMRKDIVSECMDNVSHLLKQLNDR